MSADNWTTCKGCDIAAEAKSDVTRAELAAAYGRVSREEYERLRAVADEAMAKTLTARESTFREDYEIYGAETGTVTVSYSGKCTECGYGTSFESEHPIWKGK